MFKSKQIQILKNYLEFEFPSFPVLDQKMRVLTSDSDSASKIAHIYIYIYTYIATWIGLEAQNVF